MTVRMNTGMSDVDEGDVVRGRAEDYYYSVPPHTDADGWLYAEVKDPVPDSNGDLKVAVLDENEERVENNWIDVDAMEKANTDQWNNADVDRERENELDEDEVEEENTSLAKMHDKQQNVNQMKKLRAVTVTDNLLKLPVIEVNTTTENTKWTITLKHPVHGEFTFSYEKPTTGVSEKYDIVSLLESYGLIEYDPYKLQTKSLYVEYVGGPEKDDALDTHWEILERDKVARKYKEEFTIDSKLFEGTDIDPRESDETEEEEEEEEESEPGILQSVINRIQEFRSN